MAFIAYFDFLGFKDFIERNDSDYQNKIIEDIFLNIENALGRGRLKEIPAGYIADLSTVKIHCVNFSDTVIFWVKEETIDMLSELFEVAFKFNWSCILFIFPIRGTIIQGDVLDYNFEVKNENGGTYTINSLFGKGLISAYLKAEDQNWAGTVIDNSIESFLSTKMGKADNFLIPYAKKYFVPYKSEKYKEEEWVLKLGQINNKLSEEAFYNYKTKIIDNFTNHNKRIDCDTVQIKIKNTINFLESFK